ncbi:PREDICTED: DNA cross-link repair protein SNM1 isoform X2 [Nelumbo nucifera]|uniref:DNA cross-link repair protein SNM1 isoform X2 n=1 Tax=Nelumbo nucifera TaxID=4432 RepID=A0A1U7ZMV5_NELNU|nr:PREDICTED: DNA cross-link repair protein SNM1 isoform X2 [Nelumbo nucifera]
MQLVQDEEEDISVAESLDDDGLPSLELSPESKDRGREQNGNKDRVIEAAEGSFVSDFYRSGTDWSCLLEKNTQERPPERKLKQTNLFELWGFKKPDDSNAKPRVSSLSLKRTRTQWISVESVNDRMNPKVPCLGNRSNGGGNNLRRVCPFYKKIPETSFTVDAFRYGLIEGCSGYFLSHFHCDHYAGLSKRWSYGSIYCTPLTARLVKKFLLVNPSFVHPLELDIEYVIDGIKVTMLEANHCPGAALVHFRLENGQCYLHTGDFRACKLMQSYPLLVNHRVNVLYLDTTYCNPKYRFPSKEDVLDFIVKTTKNSLKRHPKTLIVVGAYSIGKECVYLAISEALGVKIYTNASRRRILQSFDWTQLSGKLCSCGEETPLHILPISSLRPETLAEYLKTYKHKFTAVLAFRPTGWTYSEASGNQLDLIKPSTRGNIMIYGVPYSEHSSFLELKEFVQEWLKVSPQWKVSPTSTRPRVN